MPRPPLRVGMLTMQGPPWAGLLDHWRRYEALGFDSIWVCDHFVGQEGEPRFEAWTALAALAAATDRVRLGTVVSCMAFRRPELLVRQAATVDAVGGGRLELGIGAGWWGAEHRSYGVPFPPAPERVARFRDYVATVDRLLGAAANGGGALASAGPPLVLAAQGPRMLEIVARYADAWVGSFGLSPDEVGARNRLLDERCAAHGRDPAAVRRLFCWAPWVQAVDPWASPEAFLDFVGRYRDAGIDEFVLDEPRPEQRGTQERIAAEVLPGLRAEADGAARSPGIGG